MFAGSGTVGALGGMGQPGQGAASSIRLWGIRHSRRWGGPSRGSDRGTGSRRSSCPIVSSGLARCSTVVDLASAGTITCRLLDRLPRARSVAVDVDPVLLTIAAATFADDARVRIVRRGPSRPDVGRWTARAAGRCRAHGYGAALAPPGHCQPPVPEISLDWSAGVAWWRTPNRCR
jgi:hypothetical protein